MTGFKDPTNRRTFPWDNIDNNKLEFYKIMGDFRSRYKEEFSSNYFQVLEIDENKIVYRRKNLMFIVNRSDIEIEYSDLKNKNIVFSIGYNKDEKIGPYSAISYII